MTANESLNRKQNPYDIDVNNRKCRRCAYCVQICPAKAIKVEKDGFRVIQERCVMCGGCIRACPQGALTYHGGLPHVKEFFAEGMKTIAVLDPSFPVETDLGTPRQVVSLLKQIGFHEVWEGAFGAELVSQAYFKLLNRGNYSSAHLLVLPGNSFLCPEVLSSAHPEPGPRGFSNDCYWQGSTPAEGS